MDAEKFNLVFSGELVRGIELDQAKANLAKLFGISSAKVESLFIGKPVVLKKNLDFDAANKYRVAMKKAGCRVDLVSQIPSKAEASPKRATFPISDPALSDSGSSAKNAPAPESTQNIKNTDSEEPTHTQPEPYQAQPESEKVEQDSMLAPVGSDLLSETEREGTPPVEVDVSHISMRDAGEDLLDSNEREHVEVVEVDLEADLAPVGADLLNESERAQIPELNIDVSEYTLADAGEDLGQLKDEKPAVRPDIGYLELE